LRETNERRSEKRSIFTATFEFRRNPPPAGSPLAKELCGVIASRSERGLCFYSSLPLDAGEDLTLFCQQLDSAPLKAQVRWCRKFADDLFKTGVSLASGTMPPLKAKRDSI
jgi:hypothetical protein